MNFRKKRRKPNNDVEDMDITSLLDILVILLVFLLKSFNDSDLTVDLVNELALPYSLSRVGANTGLILQVNKKGNVFINADVIGNMSNPNTFNKIRASLNKEYKEKMQLALKGKKPSKDATQLINFVFDKGLKYASINKIMDVTSETGFGKYKLIIQGEE